MIKAGAQGISSEQAVTELAKMYPLVHIIFKNAFFKYTTSNIFLFMIVCT